MVAGPLGAVGHSIAKLTLSCFSSGIINCDHIERSTPRELLLKFHMQHRNHDRGIRPKTEVWYIHCSRDKGYGAQRRVVVVNTVQSVRQRRKKER